MKKICAWIVIIFMLLSCIVPFIKTENKILGYGIKRSISDIKNDKIVYLDENAIALSDSSDENTSLRVEALEAVNLINDIRRDSGENGLIWCQNLEETSMVRAQECYSSFSHTRPNGKAWNTVNSAIQGGENLAFGFDNAQDVVDAWMDSPTHADNIMYSEFTKAAISIYEADDGTFYWANEFSY